MRNRTFIKLVIFLSAAETRFLEKLSLLDDVFQSATGLNAQEVVFQAKKSWEGLEQTEEKFGHGLFLLDGENLGATVFEFENGYFSFNVDNLLSLEIVLFPPNWKSMKYENYDNWKKSLLQLLDNHIEKSRLNIYIDIDTKKITGSMLSKYLYLKKESLYGPNVVVEKQGNGKACKRNIALLYPFLVKKIDAFSKIGVSIIDEIDLKEYDSIIKNSILKKDLCLQLKALNLNPYRWFKLFC